MTEDDALRENILAHPDDDLPRLIYADFLEESGNPEQAEFIRLQCESARLPPDDPARISLQNREAELLPMMTERSEWRGRGVRVRYHRGFVEAVHTTATRLVAIGERLFATQPIRELRITNLTDQVEALAQLEGLNQIRSLDLSNNHFSAGLVLEQLLNVVSWESLTSLTIRNAVLWPSAIGVLAASPVASRLRHLNLSGNPISDEGVQALAEQPAFANLEELILRSDGIPYYDVIRADGAVSLAQSVTLTRLRKVILTDHAVGGAGLIALVNSPNAATLEVLDVAANEIGPMCVEAAVAVAESPYLGELKELYLDGNHWNLPAIQALLRWPRLTGGVVVHLNEADLDEPTRRELEQSPLQDRFRLSLNPGTRS